MSWSHVPQLSAPHWVGPQTFVFLAARHWSALQTRPERFQRRLASFQQSWDRGCYGTIDNVMTWHEMTYVYSYTEHSTLQICLCHWVIHKKGCSKKPSKCIHDVPHDISEKLKLAMWSSCRRAPQPDDHGFGPRDDEQPILHPQWSFVKQLFRENIL